MFKKQNLAKLLNLILRQKDSITFVDGTLIQDSNLDVSSVDVDYLFINISLDKTIDICINKLFQNPETLFYGISKNAVRNFLGLATTKWFFAFNNNFYIHVNDNVSKL